MSEGRDSSHDDDTDADAGTAPTSAPAAVEADPPAPAPAPTSRRSSSRSTKFNASLKEPNGESIRDLLGGMSERVAPARSSSKSKTTKSKSNSKSKATKKKTKPQDKNESEIEEEKEEEEESEGEEEEESSDEEMEEEEEEKPKPKPTRRNARRTTAATTDTTATAVATTPPPPKRTSRARKKKPPTPKSPAVRHSRSRRQINSSPIFEEKDSESEDESDSDSNSDSDSDSDSEDEKSDIKIQRILAVKMESKRQWRIIMRKISTSEIESGSRWFQENLDTEEDDDDDNNGHNDNDNNDNNDNDNDSELDKFEERFLVKWSDLGYLHCSWELKQDLLDQVEGSKQYLTTFFKKNHGGFYFHPEDRMDGEFYDPEYNHIERVLEVTLPEGWRGKHKPKAGVRISDESNKHDHGWGIIMDEHHEEFEHGTGREFLIKWGSTSYTDCTYEYERDLISMDVDYVEHVEQCTARVKKPTKTMTKRMYTKGEEGKRRMYKIFGDAMIHSSEKVQEERIGEFRKTLEDRIFRNGGQLRDYQAEGVSWLLANHVNGRSAILADEMGLGKTIQTAAYIQMVHESLFKPGPYLIVAPLSTIPHWQREFEGWTNFNTIVYHGSAEDRKMIREFEFAFECDRPRGALGYNARYLRKCRSRKETKLDKLWMVDVVITTPEMLVTEDFVELMAVHWELLVVDEAHRLKSNSSKLAVNLRDERFKFHHTLLLTGTPIQNNMSELWSLMNVIDPTEFDNCDAFLERYDNMQSKERVDELHGVIRPYMLRRLKEDVEKSVPPKEETVIEVELTVLQKQYYRALYEKNVGFLHRDLKKALDGPSLNNLSMQLRKCCNHPFLLEGVEAKAKKGLEVALKTAQDEADFLAKSSGKLVLLDKLLPKLKEGGHRILIFSQFKIMLDIIEDYLALKEFKFERIDGSITGKKRQMAIDRFQAKDAKADQSFIMLLSTRAGGVGINLTAADTCIIFDSDWNPQNDLQAQARCHRIGQTKSVKIYRLLARKTYEMQMFHMSSLKMGLDQAVLQGIEASGGNESENMTKEEVEKLLRHGAYDMFREEQEGAAQKESEDFMELDIDTILERRSKKVVHENTGTGSKAAGGTFSKASFSNRDSTNGASGVDQDVDIDDPDFWTKMVGEAKVEKDDVMMMSGKKRSRKNVIYDESLLHQNLEDTIRDGNANGSDASNSGEDDDSDESFDDDEEPSDFMEEFNFTVEYKNEFLRYILAARRKSLEDTERKRWGGKAGDQWAKVDVDVSSKLLHRFGYGNVEWDDIFISFREEASKTYEDLEIKRMFWSVVLLCLRECVDDSIQDAARRLRKAKSKREGEEDKTPEKGEKEKDGHSSKDSEKVIDEEIDPDSKEWKEKQRKQSFEKALSGNSWIMTALRDAIEYAKEDASKARDHKILDASSEVSMKSSQSFIESFAEEILPALNSRGWKNEGPSNGNRKYELISPHGNIFHSVAEVLDILPSLHPELEGLVNNIILTEMKKIPSPDDDLEDEKGIQLNLDNLNYESLDNFLKSFSPLQLLVDRLHLRRVSFSPQRVLAALGYCRNAHIITDKGSLTAQASGDSMNVAISKLLDINPKATLPHPKWNRLHDAILVAAISKHGWIDRDVRYRIIMEDKSIKWGAPFGESDENDEKEKEIAATHGKNNQQSVDAVKAVAERTAAFLNSEEDLVKQLKSFNMNLVLKSYCINPVSNTDESEEEAGSTKWEIDIDELKKILDSSGEKDDKNGSKDESDESNELPTRKELLRRAKILLSRPLNDSPSPTSTSDTTAAKSHDFAVLDQSNVCNIFLAELLREAIRIGQRETKRINKVLTSALKEAETRSKYVDKEADSSKQESDRIEMEKIMKHVALVLKNSKPLVRGAKNVLRAILGLELHQSVKSGDPLFVKERVPLPYTAGAGTKKKKPKKSPKIGKDRKIRTRPESTFGDNSVNKALSLGKQVMEDSEGYLELTSIETLMLSVLCSQGMPVCSENWLPALDGEFDEDENYALSWFQTGSVLEAAAETWYNMTASRVTRARRAGENSMHLVAELDARQLVYSEAASLRRSPPNLAKKSIMLVQAVRLHSRCEGPKKSKNKVEPRIGHRTINWSANHMARWAQALGIFFNGKVLSNTVIAARPEISPAAYLDAKGSTNIYCQILQQTRLRALCLKYDEDELVKILPKAIKSSASKDEWLDQPSWWGKGDGDLESSNASKTDDENLISGILQYGFGGFDEMVRQEERFSKCTSTPKTRSSPFDRLSAQHRLDCLTRELGAIDDTQETMRIINDRKNRNTSQRNDSEGKQSSSTGTHASSVQVGIDAFFMPTKKSAVIDCDDDSSIEVIADVDVDDEDNDNSGEKRKTVIEISEGSPSKKKTKK